MREALKAAMTTSISEVLETMFFMTIEATEDTDWTDLTDSTASGEKLYASKINFKGPLSGTFFLMVPESILSAMTEMFMGLEENEVTETHLSGTILEAINIVAGNTFSKLDDQTVFDLEIPDSVETASLSSITQSTDKELIFYRIETPGGNLGLLLFYSV
jgi:chemotaxis protein CheY-P-specific phosphatase CheC